MKRARRIPLALCLVLGAGAVRGDSLPRATSFARAISPPSGYSVCYNSFLGFNVGIGKYHLGDDENKVVQGPVCDTSPVDCGDEIYASAEGRVTYAAAPGPSPCSGVRVHLEHLLPGGGKVCTMYLHLQHPSNQNFNTAWCGTGDQADPCSPWAGFTLPAVGSTIGQGVQVGRLGNTGYSSGPHLHYEVRLDWPFCGSATGPGYSSASTVADLRLLNQRVDPLRLAEDGLFSFTTPLLTPGWHRVRANFGTPGFADNSRVGRRDEPLPSSMEFRSWDSATVDWMHPGFFQDATYQETGTLVPGTYYWVYAKTNDLFLVTYAGVREDHFAGDRVEVWDGPVNVRTSPGHLGAANVSGQQATGAPGTALEAVVRDGDGVMDPDTPDGDFGYAWVHVDFDSGVDGWVATYFLDVIPPESTPPPFCPGPSSPAAGAATLDCAPVVAPSVVTEAASLVGSSSAVLNMTVNPNGSSTDAWFLWDDDSLVDAFTTPPQSVGAGTSTVPVAYGLSALDCETTYYFRGVAENETDQTPGLQRSFTTGSCGGGGPGTPLENGGFEDGAAHWTTAADFHIGQASWPRSGSWYAFVATNSWDPGNNLSGALKSDPVAFPSGTSAARLSFFYSITTDETTSSSERDKLHIWIQDDSGGVLHTYDPLSNLDETPSPGAYEYWSEALPQSVLSEDIQVTFVGQTNSSLPTVFRIDDVELEATVSSGGSPDVTTNPGDEITADSARLKLTVSSNGAGTDVWFEWDDDPNLSHETDRVAVGAGAVGLTVSIELSDLDCSETYYFRAFGENVHGSDSGIQRSFATALCPGGPPVADTDPAVSITHTSALLRGDIFPNGLPTTANYEWGTDSGLGYTTSAQSVGSGDQWVDFPQVLSGLACGTEHFFRAHAENGAGGDDGLTYSFTTLTCFPDNQAPLAGIDSFYTPLDQVLAVPAPGVLGNDSDPEDDPVTSHLVDPATHGQVALYSNGSFSYTPAAGFDGSDTFTYVASDGLLDSALTKVTILVGTPPPILWPNVIDLDTTPGTESVPVTRIYGQLPQASFARELASGDFNADGFTDMLIGAEDAEPLGREDAGAAYVVWGAAGLSDVPELDIDEGGVTSIYGLVDDEIGSCVAAGDVNNDGFDDLIIGAERFENGTLQRAGKVYVIYGNASMPALIDMEAALVARTEILGPDEYHFMGRSCGAGDLNGDGFDDVFAGADSTDLGGLHDVGKLFVIFGSASLGSIVDLNDQAAGVEFWGAGENDEIGSAVTAGDINDDGFDDLIFSGSGNSNRQHVYVFWGGPSQPSFHDLSASLAGITKILGPAQGDFGIGFGQPMTTGDLDHDGVEDLVASGLSSAVLCPAGCGVVFVIYGGAALSAMSTLDVGVPPGTEASAVTRLHGVAQDSYLGASVATGDFNSDGQIDLVAGASGYGERETVYAIPGRPELRMFSETTIENAAFEATWIRSPIAGISMGISSSVGDVNGDGFDDAMLGANYADTSAGTNAGAAFIVYGGIRTISSPYRTLMVNVLGNGSGAVTSTPPGMTCSDQCQADYLLGSGLDLDPSADFGSGFDRWIGGGCSGTGTCSVVIDDHVSVAALFVEPDACGEADSLHLHGMSVTTTEVFEACSYLSTGTGFRVETTGDVTLRSGGSVSLQEGTSVFGDLTIESEAPDLIPP